MFSLLSTNQITYIYDDESSNIESYFIKSLSNLIVALRHIPCQTESHIWKDLFCRFSPHKMDTTEVSS